MLKTSPATIGFIAKSKLYRGYLIFFGERNFISPNEHQKYYFHENTTFGDQEWNIQSYTENNQIFCSFYA